MSAPPQADVPSLAARSRELGSMASSKNMSSAGSVPTRGRVAAAIALVRAKQAAALSGSDVETDPPSTTSSLNSRETTSLAPHGLKPKNIISTTGNNRSLGTDFLHQTRRPLSPKKQSLKDTTTTTTTTVGEESDKESSSGGSFIQNLFTSRSQAKGGFSSTTALPNVPSMPDTEEDGESSCDKDQENAPGYSSSGGTTTPRSASTSIFDKVEELRTLRAVKSATTTLKEQPEITTTLKEPHSNSVRTERSTSVRTEQSGSTVPAPPSLSFDSDDDSDPGVDPNTLLKVSKLLDKIGSKSKSVKETPKTDRIEDIRATKTDLEQSDSEDDDSSTVASSTDGVNPDTLAEIGAFIDAIAHKNSNETAPDDGIEEDDSSCSDDDERMEDEVPPETQNDVLSFIENLEKKKKETPYVSPSIPSVPSMTDTEQALETEQVPENEVSKDGSTLYSSSSDSCDIPKPSVDSIYQLLEPVPQGANIDPPAYEPYYVSDKADPPTPDDVVEELMRMKEASSDGIAPSYSVESLDSESTYNTEAASVSFTQEEKKEEDDDDDANSEAVLSNDAYDNFATEVKHTLESRKKLSSVVALDSNDSAEWDDAATFGHSVNTDNPLTPVVECGTSKEEESEDEKRGIVASLEEGGVIDLTKYELKGNTIFMAESMDPQEVETSESMDCEAWLEEALVTLPSVESADHSDIHGILSQDSSEILRTDSKGSTTLGSPRSLATRSESEENAAQDVSQVFVVDEGDEGFELMDTIPAERSVIHPPATQRKLNPTSDLDSARAAAALLTKKKDTTERDGCFIQCVPSAGKEAVPDKVQEKRAEFSEQRIEDASTSYDWSEMPSQMCTTGASTKSAGPDDVIERMRSDDDTLEKKDSDTPQESLKVDETIRDQPSLLDGIDDASESKNARRTTDEDDDFVAAFLFSSETVDTAAAESEAETAEIFSSETVDNAAAESEAETAETNECYVRQGVDAFEVALDKSPSDIGKNKSEDSFGSHLQLKEEPSGATQSDTEEGSEIFLEQFAALGVDEESNENAEATSKKDKKKQAPAPIETKSDLKKAIDPPASPVKKNKLRFDLRTPRQIVNFLATLEPSDEASVDEKRHFKSFKKLIAPAIEGEKPSIVDTAKIRQAAQRAKVPVDAVDQILEHAEGRQSITLPSALSNEFNADSNLDDAEEVDEEEAISAFLSTDDHKYDKITEFVDACCSQEEVVELVDVNKCDGKIEKIAQEDEDEDGEDEWWKVSRKEKKRAKQAPDGSTWDDASSTDISAANGREMETEDEDETVIAFADAEDEVPSHAADAKTLRGTGRNGIRVESPLKSPSSISVETPTMRRTHDSSDDIGKWIRKSEMATYGTSWEQHKRWLAPGKISQVGKPKPVDGVAAADNLNKISQRKKFLPADPWYRTYKERTKYHQGYFNVHVYSIYETSAADHGEPDELDFIPWEHRDIKQRFLQEKSIMFSRNWFGDLVRVRGNDKYRAPVCQPKSMEMPMENIPDAGEWTEEWYTTWKAPGNSRNISASQSGSEGSSVDEGSGSFSGNDSVNDRAFNVGGDNTDDDDDDDDDSWEEAPECGTIVNVKQKIGERVSRVHPDYTSSLRRSRWRRKYFPRGTFPY